jgi:hypothetical protein
MMGQFFRCLPDPDSLKPQAKLYLHESSRQSDLRVVLPIKRNTWMIFSPC